MSLEFNIHGMGDEINYNNPILQRILSHEKTQYHVCPICEEAQEDILKLKDHIEKEHADKITEYEEEIKHALDPFKHIRSTYVIKSDETLLTMGELFGKRITSRHNQNCILNIIGKQGMGKSNAAIYIAATTAEYVAKVKGGKPEDYFTLDNVAIMRLDEIVPIMKDLKQYNIYILDDIGASYGAREFGNIVNKNFNKIIQTFRDTNTLLILTMPDAFLIDKVPRKLAHYQIEMWRAVHHLGVSLGKLSEVKEIYKQGKTIYPFVTHDGVKYTRCLMKKMNNEMSVEYEKRRQKAREAMQADCLEAIEQGPEPKKEVKVPKYQAIIPDVLKMRAENPKISVRDMAVKLSCNPTTVHNALSYEKNRNTIRERENPEAL